MRKPLTEEELDWIVSFALEQITVEDVLDIIDICKMDFRLIAYGIITPPKSMWNEKITAPGFLDDIKHLQPIYRHAIRLINSQEDALLIYDCGFLDGIPKSESSAAFFIALEFCDSLENLDRIADAVLSEVGYTIDFFSCEEEFLAIFEKKRELSENENE
ncbi:MAG: hypothetical protein ACWGHO_00485 [Candidatus Moraniibacteriota bacterium]